MTDLPTAPPDMAVHYQAGGEQGRLDDGALGTVEFLRTTELIEPFLPPAASVIADIGGGPGRYALWLAEAGHRVEHRDLMPLHVDQLRVAVPVGSDVRSAVGDARRLDLADASVDAVLLLGPLYHLEARQDRVQALAEARRIGRPGAPVFVAAISRWAPRLHGFLADRLYERVADLAPMIDRLERNGRLPPLFPGSFTGYLHRPGELRSEVQEAGLTVEDIAGVEGLAFALADLDQRMATDVGRSAVLESARALQHVPELLGMNPHFLLRARC